MPSATIKLFLVHGDAKRLRTAELSNWTGKAIAGPRSELDGVLARDEATKSGVYFLSGIDSESGKPAVYVGEAESIRDRLRGQLKERASAHQYPYTLVSRKRLIDDGTLVQDGDHLKFTGDAEFSSPSAAATVVHGGSANGLLAWKGKSGKTLKELEAV